MAKKQEKFRKLEKVNGKVETKVGKYYQIADKHSIKSDKVLRIETKLEIIEHDLINTLPEVLKVKQAKKDKTKK